MNFFGLYDKNKKLDNQTIKIKQKGFQIFIFGSLILAIIAGMYLFGDKKDNQNIGNFDLYKDDDTVKTKWISGAAQELKTQDESIKSLQDQMRILFNENQKLRESIETQKNKPIPQQKIIQVSNKLIPQQKKDDSDDVISKLLGKKDGLYTKYPDLDTAKFNPDMFLENSNDKSAKNNVHKKNNDKTTNNKSPIVNIGTGGIQTITEEQIIPNTLEVTNIIPPKKEDKKEDKKRISLLPAGSILHGTIINGMDAPTMSQAKDNPLIMEMVLNNLAILPNKRNFDLRQCFILGEGYGDLASERVYVRTTTLSCINSNDEVIDLKLKGYVAGEDGKIGLRGDVVSKQGAVLARAIVAGFVDGIAKGFSQTGDTIQITPFGQTQSTGSLDGTKLLAKGTYNGLSEGANRLMDFYLKLADQVFPVIEIAAGRKVDIIVTSLEEVKSYSKEEEKEK